MDGATRQSASESTLLHTGLGRLLNGRRPHGLGSAWFHALLKSLFKVLFNFPSWYLFAIGLAPVSSLGWSLPPVFGLQSQTTRLTDSDRAAAPVGPSRTGFSPSPTLPSKRLRGRRLRRDRFPQSTTRTDGGGAIPTVGRFPLHSPLLRESWLVSRPPPSDMLKFGR